MTDGGDTDEALMLRFAAGEVRAFEELYRRHELRVWRYLQRNLSNRSITDELMQEQRQAFLLHAEGDLTLEEIARVMSTNFETAKSRLR